MLTRLENIPLDIRQYVLTPYVTGDLSLPIDQVWKAVCAGDQKFCNPAIKRRWSEERAQRIYETYYSTNTYLLKRFYTISRGKYNYRQAVADITNFFTTPLLPAFINSVPEQDFFLAHRCRLDLLAVPLRAGFMAKLTTLMQTPLDSDEDAANIITDLAPIDDVEMLKLILPDIDVQHALSLMLNTSRSNWFAHLTTILNDPTSPYHLMVQAHAAEFPRAELNVAIVMNDEARFTRLIAGDATRIDEQLTELIIVAGASNIIRKYIDSGRVNLTARNYYYLLGNQNADNLAETLEIYRQHAHDKFPVANNYLPDYHPGIFYSDASDLYDFLNLSNMRQTFFASFTKTIKFAPNPLTETYSLAYLFAMWPLRPHEEDAYLITIRRIEDDLLPNFEVLDINRVTEPGYRQFLAYFFRTTSGGTTAYQLITKFFYRLNRLPDYPIVTTVVNGTMAVRPLNPQSIIGYEYVFKPNEMWRVLQGKTSIGYRGLSINNILQPLTNGKYLLIPPGVPAIFHSEYYRLVCTMVLLPTNAEADFRKMFVEER